MCLMLYVGASEHLLLPWSFDKICKKHPSTSRSNPEHQVTKTLLISTLHDRSYAFWLLISRSLTYSDHSLSCTSRKFNMFNFMVFICNAAIFRVRLTIFINKFCRSLQLLRMVFPHALLTRLSGWNGWIRRIRRSVVMMMPLVRFKKAVKNGPILGTICCTFFGSFFFKIVHTCSFCPVNNSNLRGKWDTYERLELAWVQ